MHANSAYNLINKPTRFPKGRQYGSPSLLDHFYTNTLNSVRNIGLLATDISDHFPIVATINIHAKKMCINDPYPYIRDYRNFNREAFNESLSDFNDITTQSLDSRFFNLNKHLLSCINKHIPLRKRTKKEMKFALKPWISKGLKRSIIEKQRLYRLSRLNQPGKNLRVKKYNRYKKKLQKALFAAQNKFYSEKIEACQNQSKDLWKIINEITQRKKKTKSVINRLKLENGKFTENSAEIANALNRYFVEVGINLAEKLSPVTKSFDTYLDPDKSPVETFFINRTNPEEVFRIINSFSSSMCEDPDQTCPKIYKLGAESLSLILPTLINDCFDAGHFPSPLKIGKVIPIFKGDDEVEMGNRRPITITSCTSKLIEKLVKKRLQSFLKKHNILSDFQFGYRSQHSTTHAILNICDNILTKFDNKMHTVSLFLDLSKGFDCVNHDILLKKLYHYGIRGIAWNFFKSYLTDRQQFTHVNGISSDFLTVLCGVPQGSVLGPLLFLLYTNDLQNASNFSINLFADDTCLSLSDKNLHTLQRNCNTEANLVDEWFKANRLTTNSKKASKFILSNYNPRLSNTIINSFRIRMGDVILEKVKSIKYLGVMLDEKITWNNQIEYLSGKLSRNAGIFSKLRYYLNNKVLLQMYHALFNSHLQYAILCWGSTSMTSLNRIQVLQNRAIRNMMKSPRFFRLDNHYLNLRILKVQDLYKLEVAKFMHSHFHGVLPNCFTSFFREIGNSNQHDTRSARSRNYGLLSCRTTRGQRSIRCYGPKIWNDISLINKNLPKVSFKKHYKNLILSNY